MTTVLNLAWGVLGGWVLAGAWFLTGVIVAAVPWGWPWTVACWRIGRMALAPFGKDILPAEMVLEKKHWATGIGNVVWFVFLGWWLALGHLLGAVFCLPFVVTWPGCVAHMRLARVSMWPLGYRIVSQEEARIIRQAHWTKRVMQQR